MSTLTLKNGFDNTCDCWTRLMKTTIKFTIITCTITAFSSTRHFLTKTRELQVFQSQINK